MIRFLQATFFCLFLSSPAAVSAQDIRGTFSSETLQLTLRSTQGSVEGEAVIEGKTRAVKGRIDGGNLAGQYEYDGEWVDFAGKLSGDKLTITSEGESYALSRVKPSTPKPTESQGAKLLSNDGWGIKMTAPTGWTGQPSQNGFVFAST